MKNSGKLTFTGMIMIFIVLYGAFVSIKLISANLTEKEVTKKIKDTLGSERGYGFTASRGEEVIIEILSNVKGIVFNDEYSGNVEVTIDNKKHLILYYYEYEIVTNLIFFKKRKLVTKEEDIRSYN